MNDEQLMARALLIAAKGGRAVAPNPLVGAVVARGGEILGEGYHEYFGGAHAEVNAISATPSEHLPDATIYVTLEPCCHFGKTPPCTELILRSGIRTVIVGTLDPFEAVASKGISKLQENGIVVTTGLLHDRCVMINRRFVGAHRWRRPYVILKWARTADGFLARSDYSSKWISSEESRALAHRWRAEETAILVGTKTAIVDDPELTVRHYSGKNPLRVVLDRRLEIPRTHNLYRGTDSTWIVTEASATSVSAACRYVRIPFDERLLPNLLEKLVEAGATSLIVEGGGETLRNFLTTGLWDEARIFTNPRRFEAGISSPEVSGPVVFSGSCGDDALHIYSHPRLGERLALQKPDDAHQLLREFITTP